MKRTSGRMLFAAVAALGLMTTTISTQSVSAANEKAVPKLTDIMFDAPHLADLKAGDRAIYKFERIVSEPKMLGQPYDDNIVVHIDKVSKDGKRDVNLLVFTGDRARGDNKVAGMTGNPILVFFLDRAVVSYSSLAGGKRAYLKNRFRISLGEDAKVEPTKVTFDGATHEGYKITIAPYAKDLNRQKMRGYENAAFEVVLSEKVPGHFVSFKSVFENTDKSKPRLEERITLKNVEVAK